MAKKTLKTLAPQAYTFELVHPIQGETGVTMTIVGTESKEFYTGSVQYNAALGSLEDDELTTQKAIEVNAQLYSNIVKGWSDDEFMGAKCTKKAAASLLKDFDNQWVSKQIQDVLEVKKNFFAE